MHQARKDRGLKMGTIAIPSILTCCLLFTTGGVIGASFEILPSYLIISVFLRRIFLSVYDYFLIILSTLFFAQINDNMAIKWLQILSLIYLSRIFSNIKPIHLRQGLLFSGWFLILTTFAAEASSSIQDLMYSLIRSGVTAVDLRNYTGGVAGLAPEPAYMGSILASISISVIAVDYCTQKFISRKTEYLLIGNLIAVFLLKSIMGAIYLIAAILIYAIVASWKKRLLMFGTAIASASTFLSTIDTLGRTSGVIKNLSEGVIRADQDVGSNRGYIFERVADGIDRAGYIFSGASLFAERPVGIADFLANAFAPIHVIIMASLLILLTFLVKSNT
ncbi:MAG: hypothetical protein WCL30_05890, partial [Pseudomonadota bacterium]